MESAKDFGAALEAARLETAERLGREAVTYRALERYLWSVMEGLAPSNETIRGWHQGRMRPDRVDPVAVTYLARLYETSVAEISPTVERRLDLLVRQSPYIGRVAA